MSLELRDYDYPLPEPLIARYPLARRDASRMLVLHRKEGRIEHRRFEEFPRYMATGDLLVLNDTRVVPARVFSDDRKVELLFLERLGDSEWKCMVRPGRRMRQGMGAVVAGVRGEVTGIEDDGSRRIVFSALINPEEIGEIPLPPYLERQPEESDRERYQTVYAAAPGAVAAPTAGLHFTPEILSGLDHVFVTLHVGAGTFRPVQTELITEHRMHSERYAVTASAAEAINAADRVVAIGTTTVRVLESIARSTGRIAAGSGRTEIFIHPPFDFRVTGALLTNFHLPRSTLLMLVSAFAGRELTLQAYREAVEEGYRFYSYGDCMLVV